MSIGGTRAYDGQRDLPPLVAEAVALARRMDFDHSCVPRARSTARSRFSRALAESPMRPNTRPKIPCARLAARVSPRRSARRSDFSAA